MSSSRAVPYPKIRYSYCAVNQRGEHGGVERVVRLSRGEKKLRRRGRRCLPGLILCARGHVLLVAASSSEATSATSCAGRAKLAVLRRPSVDLVSFLSSLVQIPYARHAPLAPAQFFLQLAVTHDVNYFKFRLGCSLGDILSHYNLGSHRAPRHNLETHQ